MNTAQGQAPVLGKIIGENLAQFSLHTNKISPDHKESVQFSKFQDRSSLEKILFFSCEKCSGPLIPISECKICHKTSFRKCRRCGSKTTSGNHTSCECLVNYSNQIVKDSSLNQEES